MNTYLPKEFKPVYSHWGQGYDITFLPDMGGMHGFVFKSAEGWRASHAPGPFATRDSAARSELEHLKESN